MYQNFSSFLANSLRFLNIANRVIPLVRDVAPQISKVRNTVKRLTTAIPNVLPVNNSSQQQSQIQQNQNNGPTFFSIKKT